MAHDLTSIEAYENAVYETVRAMTPTLENSRTPGTAGGHREAADALVARLTPEAALDVLARADLEEPETPELAEVVLRDLENEYGARLVEPRDE